MPISGRITATIFPMAVTGSMLQPTVVMFMADHQRADQ